jgi:polysaccharide biosynthesis protein PelB
MTPKTRSGRRRLISPWVLAACGVTFLLGVAFLFPKASLFQQLTQRDKEDRADSVKVILLQALIKKGETGFALRREYVRQLGLTGNYDLALEELDALASNWRKPDRDSLWKLQVEVASWALAAGRGDAETARKHLLAGAEGLGQGKVLRYLAWAARKLQAAGAYDLSASLYLKAAASDSSPILWQRRAAEMFAAAGDCANTSQTWMKIYDRVEGEARRREALLEALRVLQACDRMDEALRLAESRIRPWRDDTEILLHLVNLARAADRPKLAERYAQMLVRPLAAGPDP